MKVSEKNMLNNEFNKRNSLDLITRDILKRFAASLKLLMKNKYVSGISLIECNEIPIKHYIDYECEITIQMNHKYEDGMRELQNKLGIYENDQFQSTDGKYCYLPPNTLIA
jgi:hypothetical protein